MDTENEITQITVTLQDFLQHLSKEYRFGWWCELELITQNARRIRYGMHFLSFEAVKTSLNEYLQKIKVDRSIEIVNSGLLIHHINEVESDDFGLRIHFHK